MNGAESLLKSMGYNGIDVCFANPGTSEMHFVAALDRSPQVRGILALFEGVATGAADGYSRMLDRPAATLLHLGPGMANGLSSLHNGLRARSSIVNIIGDHASYHRGLDAPLTSDIEGAARPFSDWVRTSQSASTVADDAADAIGFSHPGRIASLILPADTAWNSVDRKCDIPTATVPAIQPVNGDIVEAAARRLSSSGSRTAILMGGRSLRAPQLEIASRIADATGASLLAETFSPRIERGEGIHTITKIPYPVEPSIDLLRMFEAIVLVDAKPPVAFFAYPDKPSVLTRPGTAFYSLSPIGANSLSSLEALNDAVGRSDNPVESSHPSNRASFSPPASPSGSITAEKLAVWLAGAIPENAIVLDESITTGRSFYPQTAN